MAHTRLLFQPMSIRSVTVRNRLSISPMCQYLATNGVPGYPWRPRALQRHAAGGLRVVAVFADPGWPARAARRLGVTPELPKPDGRAILHE